MSTNDYIFVTLFICFDIERKYNILYIYTITLWYYVIMFEKSGNHQNIYFNFNFSEDVQNSTTAWKNLATLQQWIDQGASRKQSSKYSRNS